MAIRLYTAAHCGPCQQVKELLSQGKVEAQDRVEVVDIETDEGFEEFSSEVLSKGDGAVPSAYRDGQQCQITIDKERGMLVFDCPPTDAPPEAPSG